jgi:hypothetical protein
MTIRTAIILETISWHWCLEFCFNNCTLSIYFFVELIIPDSHPFIVENSFVADFDRLEQIIHGCFIVVAQRVVDTQQNLSNRAFKSKSLVFDPWDGLANSDGVENIPAELLPNGTGMVVTKRQKIRTFYTETLEQMKNNEHFQEEALETDYHVKMEKYHKGNTTHTTTILFPNRIIGTNEYHTAWDCPRPNLSCIVIALILNLLLMVL